MQICLSHMRGNDSWMWLLRLQSSVFVPRVWEWLVAKEQGNTNLAVCPTRVGMSRKIIENIQEGSDLSHIRWNESLENAPKSYHM